MNALNTIAVGSVAILIVMLIWTRRDGRPMISFLVGASAGLVGIQLGGIHVFTLVSAIWAFWPGGTWRTKLTPQLSFLGVASVLLAMTAIFGDLVNSPTLALQLLAMTGTAILIALRSTASDANSMLKGLLASTTIGSTVGLLQVAGVVPMELWHLSVSAIGRPTGIYPEPDWLGLFAGIGVILAWRLKLGTVPRTIIFTANFAAFVLAFARAAWVGVIAAIAAYVFIKLVSSKSNTRRRSQGRRGKMVAFGVALCVSMVALVAIPALRADLITRFATLLGTTDAEDISGEARIRQINALIELADSAPFYGHGLSASGRVSAWGEITLHGGSGNNVASNWLLAYWVDGAYLSIPLLLVLVVVALRTAQSVPGQLLIVVFVNSFFSNATYFPVAWLLVGLSFVATETYRYKPEGAILPVARVLHGSQVGV